jgi:hypothetical protein
MAIWAALGSFGQLWAALSYEQAAYRGISAQLAAAYATYFCRKHPVQLLN